MRKIKVSILLLSLGLSNTFSHAAAVVDQSQLTYNIGMPLQFSFSTDTNVPLGQSFTAGQTGKLDSIQLLSNGTLTDAFLEVRLYAGDGVGGPELGTIRPYGVSSAPVVGINYFDVITLDFSTANVRLQAGSSYTFAIVRAANTGNLGDWLQRGVLASQSNPYSGGHLYAPAYGSPATWDLAFRTSVQAIPEPQTWSLLMGGVLVIGFAALRRREMI